MRTFQEAVVTGSLNSQSALLLAYGLYLAHGGRSDDFGDLTVEDVNIMLAAYIGQQAFDRIKTLEGLAMMISKMFRAD